MDFRNFLLHTDFSLSGLSVPTDNNNNDNGLLANSQEKEDKGGETESSDGEE